MESAKQLSRRVRMLLAVTVIVVFGLLCALAGYGYFALVHKSEAPKPQSGSNQFAEVAAQAGFVVFAPSGDDGPVTVNQATIMYDARLQHVTFTAYLLDSIKLVFGQQALPDEFVGFPERYDSFVNAMNLIDEFEGADGAVHIAKPKDLPGHTVAVMKAKGTLVTINAEGDVDKQQWRQLFSTLRVVEGSR